MPNDNDLDTGNVRRLDRNLDVDNPTIELKFSLEELEAVIELLHGNIDDFSAVRTQETARIAFKRMRQAVAQVNSKRAEQLRTHRRAALKKLTKSERELLGLAHFETELDPETP